MARLRLITRIPYTESYQYGPTHEQIDIWGYRLHLRLHFVPPDFPEGGLNSFWNDVSRRFDAIVDTGAGFTNIPFEIWEPFASEIQWLAPGMPNDRMVTIAGTTCSYRLGRVRLLASDLDGRYLPAAWTITRCLEFTPSPTHAILGLHSPFLMSQRELKHTGASIESQTPEWWLRDRWW